MYSERTPQPRALRQYGESIKLPHYIVSRETTDEWGGQVGIVIEQKRPQGTLDKLRWYCAKCKEIVYEDAFHCTNLGTQIKDAVNKFKDSEELRTCGACGDVAAVAPAACGIPPPGTHGWGPPGGHGHGGSHRQGQ